MNIKSIKLTVTLKLPSEREKHEFPLNDSKLTKFSLKRTQDDFEKNVFLGC